jgi:DDE superfamily endonuclease/Helix-turn-helix of DDE superfamily endonuclease
MVLCLLMELKEVLANPKQLQMLTGLSFEEFDDLARTFAQVWQEHTRRNWRGRKRQRAKGGGPQGRLDTPGKMLFFILVYFRHHPTQEFIGAQFGFGQSQANRWIMRLTPLLKEALQRELTLPERRPSKLDRLLKESGSLKLLLDGTDRPIRRPQSPEKQKECYSGRKKRHTVKNVVLTCQRAVQFLSPTAPGKQSDKRLAEPLERVDFPTRSVVLSDLGFQGLNLDSRALIHPVKKPKGRELNPIFRPFNRTLAAIRVGVEHVISGVKRCRIVSDTLRHLKEEFKDLVMEVACGLHNFREFHRSPTTPTLLPIQLN